MTLTWINENPVELNDNLLCGLCMAARTASWACLVLLGQRAASAVLFLLLAPRATVVFAATLKLPRQQAYISLSI